MAITLPKIDTAYKVESILSFNFPDYKLFVSEYKPTNALGNLHKYSNEEDGKKVIDFWLKLKAMSSQEIDALYDACLEERKNAELEEHTQWESGLWYNQEDAKPDLEYWSRMSYWSLDEAIALAFHKEPRKVSWESIKKYTQQTFKRQNGMHAEFNAPTSFALQYEELRNISHRAKGMKNLTELIHPTTFIAWMRDNQLPFSKELEAKVISLGNDIISWKEQCDKMHEGYKKVEELYSAQKEITKIYKNAANDQNTLIAKLESEVSTLKNASSDRLNSEKTLSTRERDTLLKIIIGMAVDGYGYNPNDKRNSIAKEVEDALARLGINVSDDTIRAKIQEGKDLIEPEALAGLQT